MTLDEAIERHTNNAEYERTHGSLQGCLEFRQLAEWLRELKRNRDVLQEIQEEIRKDAEWWSEHDSLREQVLRDVLEDIIAKTGQWLRTGEEVDVYYDLPSYECSKCGKTSLENGDYCPNCGAKMESEEQV